MPIPHDVPRDDALLRAWEWPGGDPPALLLHGIGNYGRYWDFVATEVAGTLRLVAPDARGHGDSAKPAADEGTYSAERFVDDAVAILDALRIGRALLVGHSMGGGHAIGLAARHPERVRGLVIVDVGPELLPEGAERARRLSLGRPEELADGAAALAYLRETSPGYTDAVYRNRLDWCFRVEGGRLRWRSSRDALAAILAETRRVGAMWEELARIACPVLVVRGTRSPVLAAETARRMTEEIPRARLLELDAAHNVPLDRPRELAAAIVDLATSLSGEEA
ncbi:MAG: alpha/beta fold hydrolase [Candidatus Limnocylindria bacterium]